MLFYHNHIVKLIKNNFILKYLLKYMLILFENKFKYILLIIKILKPRPVHLLVFIEYRSVVLNLFVFADHLKSRFK